MKLKHLKELTPGQCMTLGYSFRGNAPYEIQKDLDTGNLNERKMNFLKEKNFDTSISKKKKLSLISTI